VVKFSSVGGRLAGWAGWGVLVVAPLVLDGYWLNLLTLGLIASIGVFSINVLTGLTGLLSFGQAGFIGLGAYTYGVATTNGVPIAVAAVAGVLVPTVAGGLLALPAARLKGSYLAIGTLGFGVLVAQLLNNMVEVTRGPMGLLGIRSVGLDRLAWCYLAMAMAVTVMLAIDRLGARTYFGVVLKAVNHDEISAAASGVPVFAVKLVAFAASASLAGLCGVLLAGYLRFLTPDLFGTAESFRYLMIAVVGGVGSATGGLIAAIGLTLVPEGLRVLGETNIRLLVYGALVLFVLWFLPGGIGGLLVRRPAASVRRGSR
jgi:branched-chain amino acid transport system permease protein